MATNTLIYYHLQAKNKYHKQENYMFHSDMLVTTLVLQYTCHFCSYLALTWLDFPLSQAAVLEVPYGLWFTDPESWMDWLYQDREVESGI